MDLVFLRKIQNAPLIWSFFFDKPPALQWQPGDYVEISLAQAGPHGDKRWMTIASSPSEDEVMFTTKIPERPSEYKLAMSRLTPGDIVTCSPPMGNFNLPKNESEKLLFVAAGIGITPYRSMLKWLQDNDDSRDIVLVYTAKPDEFICGDVIEGSHIPVFTSSERIDFHWIKKQVTGYTERTCYFAGPQPLCESLYEQALSDGRARSSLKLSYFEGYDS